MSLFKPTLFVLAALFVHFPTIAQDKQAIANLVIGTYSQQNSEGIYTTTLDLFSGKLAPPQLAFTGKDPTYLAVSSKNIIYAALRESNGLLTALAMNNENKFNIISQQEVYGNDPCYLSLSPNEQYIASANYNGSNVSIFRLSSSGMIDTPPSVLMHQGSSVNAKRQTSPHPHWVQWSPHNENILYVIDLGTDKVMKYDFNYATGAVSKGTVAFSSNPGDGPRHLVFHPTKKRAYILNELSNTIDLVNIQADGSFSLINQKSTLPKEYVEHNQAAHIAINSTGEYLYASNRGLNSIAVFTLSEQGEMTLKENVDTGGDWPRFFRLFEEYGFLLVANKKSNNITVFKVQEDGSLQNTDYLQTIGQPTFIAEYSGQMKIQ
jgi:6-phosphogluconolactonase